MRVVINDAALDKPADQLPRGIAFAVQWKQAEGQQPMVQCATCDRSTSLRYLFRCLYCNLWFCKTCGEVHFGEAKSPPAQRPSQEPTP